ncbi:MAG: c-type cytochrome [Lewinellaceae bacterium]|nr:c-type cytochrome [Lewinellaceae bacterium]
MKKAFKWIGIVILSLIIIALGTAFYLNSAAKSRFAKKYDIQPRAINIPTDSASIASGKNLVTAMCTTCHGDDLGGTEFFVTDDLGTINAPNLTPGGVGKTNSDLDWDRAIRHGIGGDKRPLFIMPASDFQYFSDEHMGQMIAYLKTLPPVESNWVLPKTTLLCNILVQTGAFGDVLNAETIDHNAPSHTAPERGATADYGNYLVKVGGCRTCHGPELNGGKDPNPEAPPGPNLTPGGSLPSWGEDGFIKTMRTGSTPMGKDLNGEFMPWKSIGTLEDDQLQAIYTYLMSLPKMETADLSK